MSQTLTPVILGFAVVPADSRGAAGSLTAPGSKGRGGEGRTGTDTPVQGPEKLQTSVLSQ